ncbi:MAG: hypothetical protein EBU46_20470, partial [Nitrosomonadaceae bacterium]|nr:hypothetical protein [Nitrosomonadaceae bacterium]
PNGDIVIVDNGNNKIRTVSLATGIIRTSVGASTSGGFAGDGGPATAALISFPTDVAFDRWGNMFIADKGNNISTAGHRIREVFFIDTLHITVSPSDTICGYARTTFTAVERKGRHYHSFIRWKLNGTPVGTNSPTYILDTAHHGDVITCSIVDTANGGFTIAVSDTMRMIVRPVVLPTLNLSSSVDTICSGAPATITARITNGGTSPTYQWYLFDTLRVGATNTTYTYTPRVGDIIKCRLNSNAICAYPASITATIPMVVVPSFPPEITLLATHDTIISTWGQQITIFTELTYEGTNPRFQWFKNGIRVPGATLGYYTYDVYGNDTIFAVMYSNAPCVVPDRDTSNVVRIWTGKLAAGSAANARGNLSLAPNPNTGSFVVTGKFANMGIGSAHLTITDM